jgi:hypothetical protein
VNAFDVYEDAEAGTGKKSIRNRGSAGGVQEGYDGARDRSGRGQDLCRGNQAERRRAARLNALRADPLYLEFLFGLHYLHQASFDFCLYGVIKQLCDSNLVLDVCCYGVFDDRARFAVNPCLIVARLIFSALAGE